MKKEDFKNATKKEFDKILENAELYNQLQIQTIKHQWTLIFWSPVTWFIIGILGIGLLGLGVCCDWSLKKMITTAFGYAVTAIITGLVEYFIIEHVRKKNYENDS